MHCSLITLKAGQLGVRPGWAEDSRVKNRTVRLKTGRMATLHRHCFTSLIMSANVLVVNRIILGGSLHGQTTDTVHRSMAGGGHACAAVVVVRRRLLAMTQ